MIDGSITSTSGPTDATGSKPESWTRVAAWNRMLFDYSVKQATRAGATGDFEKSLQWGSAGARFASVEGCFGRLSSNELEAELLRAARSLPLPTAQPKPRARQRWLHVLSQAFETLGHTNLCRRWIQFDTDVDHDVVLLDQSAKAPDNLSATVNKAGGRCIVLDIATSELERAAKLRALAWAEADVVVLHTHPEDVIAMTAFGVAGGPPVLLVNHADHTFWIGCTGADLVLDIRTSGHLWTEQARGVKRSAILPLPLFEEETRPKEALSLAQQKLAARKSLGIPEDAVVLLTIGSDFKFRPMPGFDFVATAREIIKRCGKTYLIAVGPKDEGNWRTARKATGGRIAAMGRCPDTKIYCQAADLYLEGFPSGSLTALLEATRSGLPCVRAPRECAPPFCSDGIPLDGVPQPADIADYIATAESLIVNPKKRLEMGLALKQLTEDTHCRTGWLRHLRQIKNLVPNSHTLHPEFLPRDIENSKRDWFLKLTYAGHPPEKWSRIAIPFFVEVLNRTKSVPVMDGTLLTNLSLTQTVQSSATETLINRITLWWTNNQIRRAGNYALLFRRATREFKAGQLKLARKSTYRCLLAKLSCIGNLEWLKLMAKLHGGCRLREWIRPGCQ